MSANQDSIVIEEMRRRMVAFALTLMSERLRVRHDPESVVNSAEASANTPENDYLWKLPPEDLVKCLLQKTRIHVWNRVAFETAQMRDGGREAGSIDEHGEVAGSGLDPAVVAEWKDLWDWVQQRLMAENPVYGNILTLLRQGYLDFRTFS